MPRNSGGREYDPTRITPRLPLRERSGSWWRRVGCSLLSHDLRMFKGGTAAWCMRCHQTWGGGDPYP